MPTRSVEEREAERRRDAGQRGVLRAEAREARQLMKAAHGQRRHASPVPAQHTQPFPATPPSR
eukprot:1126170-Rhodomonas_salina.1